MKRFQNFLSIGILFIFLGISLLVISSGGFESGVFFIFPFFITSLPAPIGMFLLLSVILIICGIMMRGTPVLFNQSTRAQETELMKEYLPVGSMCEYCFKPVPVDAVYCSSCGNPVDYDRTSNQ